MTQIKKCWGGCGKGINKEEQTPITILGSRIVEVICGDCYFDLTSEPRMIAEMEV